jgi:enterochelin esterase-like enzyme
MLKKIHTALLLSAVMCLLFSPEGKSQFPRRNPTPNDTLKSTEVGPDGRVTFRIYAPEAKKVSVSGDIGFENFRDLIKNEAGVWSVTTAPLKAGVYRFSFTVDGVKVNDPKSETVAENTPTIEVGSGSTDQWGIRSVPHGDLRSVWYFSSTMNKTRRMHIYTPPGYDKEPGLLPVLYLLHGGGDNDNAWPTVGRANFILDNLLAEKKIEPMIVVMPNGSVADDIFTKDLVNDIIPYVEKNYRIRTGKDDRALAGLSMGGLETLNTGIKYNNLFGYLGVLSSGWFADQKPVMDEAEKLVADNSASFNKNVKLFWISMGGKEDIAWKNCQNMLKLFEKYGLKFQYSEVPGGHTWLVWRDNLYNLAPLLFR